MEYIDPDRDDSELGSEVEDFVEPPPELSRHERMVQKIQKEFLENSFPHIPKILYAKAVYQHDQLTEEDKAILRGRGDIVGRIMADPDSLTDEEVYDFLFWPPPDVVRAKLLRVSSGAISTPRELFAKAQDAIDRNEFQTTMSNDEIELISSCFILDRERWLNPEEQCRRFRELGRRLATATADSDHASQLLMRRRFGCTIAITKMAGLMLLRLKQGPALERTLAEFSGAQLVVDPGSGEDPRPLLAATVDLVRQITFELVTPEDAATQFIQLADALEATIPKRRVVIPPPSAHPTPPSMNDQFGMAAWPPVGAPYPPYTLFMNDNPRLSSYEASPAWFYLPDMQKNVYRAKSERLRQEAWYRYNKPPPTKPATVASSESPASPPWPPYEDSVGVDSWPPLVKMMSPIVLFKTERNAQGRPREEYTLEAYRQLTDEERQDYRTRSDELRLKAWADHERFKAQGKDDMGYPYTGKLYQKYVEVEGLDPSYRRPNVLGLEPERPEIVGCVALFQEEVGPSIGVGTSYHTGNGLINREHARIVYEKYDELSQPEKEAYMARADEINAQNRAEHDQIMQGIPFEKTPRGRALAMARSRILEPTARQ